MMFSDSGRKAAEILPTNNLVAVVEATRHDASHGGRKVASTREKARALFTPEEGKRGGWKITLALLGSVRSLPMRAATNGGAWRHLGVGWWPTLSAAESALNSALDQVFADEAEAAAAQAAEMRAMEERRAERRRQADEDAARQAAERAEFDAAWAAEGPGLQEMAHRLGWELTAPPCWHLRLHEPYTPPEEYPRTLEGLGALTARLAAGAKPVVSLDLGGLFGGAAQVKKSRK
jgi:pyruvate/2-oxoglutarate dehydrogenase complex dihydrolipoamide acyltransferase (E2) component